MLSTVDFFTHDRALLGVTIARGGRCCCGARRAPRSCAPRPAAAARRALTSVRRGCSSSAARGSAPPPPRSSSGRGRCSGSLLRADSSRSASTTAPASARPRPSSSRCTSPRSPGGAVRTSASSRPPASPSSAPTAWERRRPGLRDRPPGRRDRHRGDHGRCPALVREGLSWRDVRLRAMPASHGHASGARGGPGRGAEPLTKSPDACVSDHPPGIAPAMDDMLENFRSPPSGSSASRAIHEDASPTSGTRSPTTRAAGHGDDEIDERLRTARDSVRRFARVATVDDFLADPQPTATAPRTVGRYSAPGRPRPRRAPPRRRSPRSPRRGGSGRGPSRG
jgi:hypothetical protein